MLAFRRRRRRLPTRQRVDVLHALRQRRLAPAGAAILRAEHLAVARGDVDLLGVGVMQADRHQRAVRLDLTDRTSIQAALDLVVSSFGGLHGVACGAGEVVRFNRIADFEVEDMERFIDRDALGCYRLFHAAIPMLRAGGGGSLTACTTIATRRVIAFDGMSPFGKGAVDALVRQVAAEEAEHGIRCNAIGMGWVEDRSPQEARAQHPAPVGEPEGEEGRIDALMNQFFAIARSGRPVTPDQAGDTYAFFASDQARHLTGQFVYLDAGILL